MKSVIKLNLFKFDQVLQLQGDHEDDWLRVILDELMEDLGEDQQLNIEKSINLAIEARKFEDKNYQLALIVKGEVSLSYGAVCGKTGELITQELEVPINCIFLDHSNKNKYDLENEITLFYQEEERDLYFIKKNQVDLYPIIREYIFLNRNPYPEKINE